MIAITTSTPMPDRDILLLAAERKFIFDATTSLTLKKINVIHRRISKFSMLIMYTVAIRPRANTGTGVDRSRPS